MSFITKIKFSNITNLSDARYAAAAGVDYLGFCFDPASPHYIPTVRAKEIIDWVTGSHIVAEFGEQPQEEITTISELLGADAVEMCNAVLPQDLPAIGKAVIRKIDVKEKNADDVEKEIAAYQDHAEAFHLFTSGEMQISDEQLHALCSRYRIIWGFPVTPGNARDMLSRYQPYAINISGSMEEKTGIKDFDELNDLLEQLQL